MVPSGLPLLLPFSETSLGGICGRAGCRVTFPAACCYRPAVPTSASSSRTNGQRAIPKSDGPHPTTPAAPALTFGDLWLYDPAPETAEPEPPGALRPVHRRRGPSRRSRASISSRSTPPPKQNSPMSRSRMRPTWTRRSGGAGSVRHRVGQNAGAGTRQISVPHRAAVAGSRAGIRGGGNARRRQTHQGVTRLRRARGGGAFLLSRRVGGQARLRVSRAAPSAAAGCRRAGDPVEFSVADAGVETRPRAGVRQLRRAQTGGDDQPHRAEVRQILQRRGTAARAWSTSCAARARSARRWRGIRWRRRWRSPGPPAWARPSCARRPRTGKRAHARTRRQGGEHRVRRRADGPGGRGRRQRHLFQPGPRLLRGQPVAGAGKHRGPFRGQAQDAAGEPARGRSAGQKHGRGRDQFARPARAHPRHGRGGRAGRRGTLPAAGLRVARERVLVRAVDLSPA